MKDGNHDNNPPDGSNWENLCVYCHEDVHSRGLLGDYLRVRPPPPARRPLSIGDEAVAGAEGLGTRRSVKEGPGEEEPLGLIPSDSTPGAAAPHPYPITPSPLTPRDFLNGNPLRTGTIQRQLDRGGTGMGKLFVEAFEERITAATCTVS